jgi:6-phosphogluconolactonase/glucosamine-6-phosphate isomerase/deaminase
MKRLKVFVSSTVQDLESERAMIKKTLGELRFESFISEFQTAQARPPSDVCLGQIDDSDIFILIIGERYGYVPKPDPTKGSPYDGKISVTHGEFLRARALRKPVLVFVKETARDQRETELLLSLGGYFDGATHASFKAASDLRGKLTQALSELLVDLVRHNYATPWRREAKVIVVESPAEVTRIVARILGFAIQRPSANIGLSAGRTLQNVYFSFFQEFKAEQLSNITETNFFSVTEHFGISQSNPNSYYHWFHQAFFDRIREQWNISIPEARKKLVPSTIEQNTVEGFRIAYDQYLQINKVDLQIISPAPDGQIICIDPDSYPIQEMLEMGTSLVRYCKQTSSYLVPVSPHDMDLVIGTRNLLSRSERLVIPAYGRDKREVVRRMILGPVGADCPASLVGRFPREDNLLFVIDRASAQSLPEEIDRHVELTGPDQWDSLWH